MERSFDLGALLMKHKDKHKIKPAQFVSFAGGIKKRLETNLKYRRSSRLTIFDRIRDLPSCNSPKPLSDAEIKVERRRQQLEKWKEDKEKRKKEQAALKKKPFVAGVAHIPLTYAPLPPLVPSTSGRVTRSQSAKNRKVDQKPLKTSQSFAPKNASFRPPEIKNLRNVPTLAPVTKPKKEDKCYVFIFNTKTSPVKDSRLNPKQSRSRTNKPMTESIESRVVTRKHSKELKEDKVTKSRTATRQNQKLIKPVKSAISSSSSSETEPIAGDLQPVTKIYTPKRASRNLNHTPICVPRSESNSEEKLRSPKSPGEVPATTDGAVTPTTTTEVTLRISPCVTLSRGKANARDEMKKKMKEGYMDEYRCAENLRRELNCQIKRLTEMCDSWQKIEEQIPLAENVQEEVLGAVGQGRLLMSSKLRQFAGLVDQCAEAEPGAPGRITSADLQGFWDMVFIQIENVDMRFRRLEQRRENNWAEEQTSQPARRAPAKNVKKTVKPTAGPSKLREMIAAARKAKKDQDVQNTTEASASVAPSGDNKVFDAGFFRVQSPVRSPAPATPINKANLLRTVLSSEARKASNSKKPFAMLHASIMSKALEAEGIAPLPQTPLTPINLHATPGRSILKSANASKPRKKSVKMVLFNGSDAEADNAHPQSSCDITECTNTDSEMAATVVDDIDKDVANKENIRYKSKITRQDAVEERSPVMTRNRRKSIQNTPQVNGTRTRGTEENTAAENVEVTSTAKRYSTRRNAVIKNGVA